MFSIATDGAPGRPNEDFVVATTDIAVVVDGAGIPQGGCHHGVAWFARQLGVHTMATLIGEPTATLSKGLATALQHVADLHRDTCDLTHTGTPCAAIGILRVGEDTVDTLSLSDVSVAVETSTGVDVICDQAIEEICGAETAPLAGLEFSTAAHQDALQELVAWQTQTRNIEGGWWVAAENPDAAQHAKTASYPRKSVTRLAVMSDGATRPVDQMGVIDWPGHLDMLDKLGPAGLIDQVRQIESSDRTVAASPGPKRHDDATVAQHIARGPKGVAGYTRAEVVTSRRPTTNSRASTGPQNG